MESSVNLCKLAGVNRSGLNAAHFFAAEQLSSERAARQLGKIGFVFSRKSGVWVAARTCMRQL